MQLKPNDVVRAPVGHVIEVHGQGTYALVRRLDAPVRLSERTARIIAGIREAWRLRQEPYGGEIS